MPPQVYCVEHHKGYIADGADYYPLVHSSPSTNTDSAELDILDCKAAFLFE